MNRENTHKFRICLDHERFAKKPTNEGAISLRIAEQEIDISLEDLAQEILIPNGRTWIPSIFDPQYRLNINWKAQQLFVLDIDHEINADIALERCRRTGLKPALVYTSFSSVKNERFRMVFAIDYVVDDERVRDVIQTALMTIFKECDKGCMDPARMFFGGKEVLHSDYLARIDIPELIESMCLNLYDQDKHHAIREIERFCSTVGLDIKGGLPYIEVIDGQYPGYSSCDSADLVKKPQNHIYINKGLVVKSPKTIVLHFRGQTTNPNESGNCRKKDESTIRNLSFMKLLTKCQLYSKFKNGRYWAYYPQLFGMVTNLWNVQGARKKFMLAISKHSKKYWSYKEHDWDSVFTYCRKSEYKPMGCDKFCPFTQECKHGKNMITQVRLCRGMVNVLEEPILISLEKAEQELEEALGNALSSKDNNIHVIKAPTSLGKTESYVQLKRQLTIVTPTHKLKNEVFMRIFNTGKKIVASPELPDLGPQFHTEMDYINKLYDIGAPIEAAKYIDSITKEKNIPELLQYKQELEDFQKVDCTVITTHERLMSLETVNDTIIVDEDILPTILQQGKVTIEDFRQFGSLIRPEQRKTYDFLLNRIVNAVPGDCCSRTGWIIWPESIEEIVTESTISTKILGFLRCDFFVKAIDDSTIYYIRRRNLPENKKIIILSATANKYIYEQLFGQRVRFSEVGRIETKGKVIQYPKRSFSRECIEINPQLLEFAKSFAGNKPVITYKAFRKVFRKPIAHFGALNGLDSFKGSNIVIVGTPHVNPAVYMLYVAALGLDTRVCRNSEKPMNIPIERNGMEFFFNTFPKGALREIQLHLIESELEQAIGRARVLRHKCEVTVLSNYPIVGAEFRPFSKENLEKMDLKPILEQK